MRILCFVGGDNCLKASSDALEDRVLLSFTPSTSSVDKKKIKIKTISVNLKSKTEVSMYCVCWKYGESQLKKKGKQ